MNKFFKKAFLLAVFGIVGFMVFYIIPYFTIIRFAFTSEDTGEFVGLFNFISTSENEFFILAMKNTLIFSAVSIPLLVIISYFIVNFTKHLRWGRVFLLLLFVPVVIPATSITNFWNTIAPANNMFSIIMLFLWKNIGLASIIMSAGLKRIPVEIYDAASIDGANAAQLHRYMILPLMSPVIIFSTLIGFVQSFKIFREIYLMYHEYVPEAIYMMPSFIFNKFNKLDYTELSAGTLIFTTIIIFICMIIAGVYLVYRRYRR